MAKGRKKVTFDEVAKSFEQVKDLLGVEADLRPVSDDTSKCAIVSGSGDKIQIESLASMKVGLDVWLRFSPCQTRLHPDTTA